MREMPPAVRTAFERHDAFSAVDSGFELETTVFDAVASASEAEGERDGQFHVEVRVPTLDAAVADETVHEVVEDGWFETLELRLEDAFDVATTTSHEPPIVTRDGEEVVVELDYVAWTARDGVADAKAVAEFVEGTYAQGIIPGYEYRGPAARLLQDAMQHGEQAADE
ncbi:DUF5813 family protein [Haloarchaeobius sp. TZWWS8]|uniref:DUF5813 family protein n=1 Tax=Haloarchaeobius sp. TZWWS8 TaxID=3446121 RepID=UPI003EBAFDF6